MAENGGGMDIADMAEAIEWQARHAEEAGAEATARIVRAMPAIMQTDTATARRLNNWHGLTLRDALPLRVAAALHWLHLSGETHDLEPVYTGITTDQGTVDGIVARLAETYDTVLLPWLDGPPQTNEAGRSAAIMGGLLWLAQRLGPRFDLLEIGASAGINTMLGRYFFDLGGVRVGPSLSSLKLVPDWKGPPPPKAKLEIVAAHGSDSAPVDLADPDQALKLKAYIWPEAHQRMVRFDAACRIAQRAAPDLERIDAADFVERELAKPQEEWTVRCLFHSIMWQYMPEFTQDRITQAMEQAGADATADKPLAWLSLETNRATFRHELTVRYWPAGQKRVKLAEAHPHGEWVEWLETSEPVGA